MVSAQKKLEYTVKDMSLDDLKAEVEVIEKRRKQMRDIRRAIEAALPTLPEMSQLEQYPTSDVLEGM